MELLFLILILIEQFDKLFLFRRQFPLVRDIDLIIILNGFLCRRRAGLRRFNAFRRQHG